MGKTIRKEIVNNDVCEMYDYIEKNMEEYFPDEDPSEVTDSQKWDLAYDEVETNISADLDENLDVECEGEIFLCGTIERWDGPRKGWLKTGTRNLGKAMRKAMDSFSGDNTFSFYVEHDDSNKNGKLFLSQLGHDNPTNPSIIEFRILKDSDEDDLSDKTVDELMSTSLSPVKYISKVFGWDISA